ncbi:MAG TPA: DUF362 domain-containing protein, partial [Clostridiaceae bacterium]|nr:DUF362 domain-containing protein [Clostridiaceae bacterium]
LMGFDPLKDLKYIRLAHDAGLGCGDVSQIEIVGDLDALDEKWNFVGPFKKMTFASRCQHLIYWGPLKKPVEWSLKTILAPWSYIASVIYHDLYWYPKHYSRVKEISNSDWGRLFANWEQLELPSDDLLIPGWDSVGDKPLELSKETKGMIKKGFKVLGGAIKEAPEFKKKPKK